MENEELFPSELYMPPPLEEVINFSKFETQRRSSEFMDSLSQSLNGSVQADVLPMVEDQIVSETLNNMIVLFLLLKFENKRQVQHKRREETKNLLKEMDSYLLHRIGEGRKKGALTSKTAKTTLDPLPSPSPYAKNQLHRPEKKKETSPAAKLKKSLESHDLQTIVTNYGLRKHSAMPDLYENVRNGAHDSLLVSNSTEPKLTPSRPIRDSKS